MYKRKIGSPFLIRKKQTRRKESEKRRGKLKKEAPLSVRDFERNNAYEKDREFFNLIQSLSNPTKRKLEESFRSVPLRIVMLKRFAEETPDELLKERINIGLSRIRPERKGRRRRDFNTIFKEDGEDKGQKKGTIFCPKCGGVSRPDGPNERKCIYSCGYSWRPKIEDSKIVVSPARPRM